MLDALATPVGIVLRTIHELVTAIGLPSASGWAWGLSIVLLTVTVRLLLFPLFVKQIKSQRRMQEIAPMVKELQKKHKGDRETLNAELMKLYKDNNANPISGCLPLLLQLPVFFALFHVIREFGPGAPEGGKFGLSSTLLEEGGRAQIFGAPVAANFRSTVEELATLGAESPTVVRVVAAVMVVLMGATTYWTQRQMIARSGTTDPQQVMIQKFMLYVLPLSFAVSGVIFPIGVLLYWVTTNVWSMGQQAYVIKRMPPPVRPGDKPAPPASKAAKGGGKAGKPDGSGPQGDGQVPAGKGAGKRSGADTAAAVRASPDGEDAPAAGTAVTAGAGTRAGGTAAPRPDGGRSPTPKGRAAGARRHKNRKGGRR